MRKLDLLIIMIGLSCVLTRAASAQVVESTSVPELQEMVRQLIRENAQLKLELDTVKRELAKYKVDAEARQSDRESSSSITIVISAIRDLTDDGERRVRIAEIKNEIPAVQTRIDRAVEIVNDMNEENRREFNRWQRRVYPYDDPKRYATFVKPHSDKQIGIHNLDRMNGETRMRRLKQELARLEKGPASLQMLLVGKSESPGDSDGEEDAPVIVEYRIMCEGGLAKRAQLKRPGDRVVVTGRVTSADEDYIEMDATAINDPKPAVSS